MLGSEVCVCLLAHLWDGTLLMARQAGDRQKFFSIYPHPPYVAQVIDFISYCLVVSPHTVWCNPVLTLRGQSRDPHIADYWFSSIYLLCCLSEGSDFGNVLSTPGTHISTQQKSHHHALSQCACSQRRHHCLLAPLRNYTNGHTQTHIITHN